MSSTPSASSRTPARTLYRKLRPRPNGPSRDDVAANQRARLYGAIIEATSTHGYAETSVAELCRLAGISKRTFYEQFANKEACFLAAREWVTSSAVKRIATAYSRHADWDQQMASALEALMHEVAEQPKAAQLVLLAPGQAMANLWPIERRARVELEQVLARGFAREQQRHPAFARVLAKGVVYGVERVACHALLDERLADPTQLAAGLTEWTLRYNALPLARPLETPTFVGHGLASSAGPRAGSRAVGQRSRILRAVAEVAAAHGVDGLSFGRISRRAEVDEEIIAGLYENVEACFCESVDLQTLDALTSVLEASRSAGGGMLGACRGILTLVERVASDPLLRETVLRDPLLVGRDPEQPGGRLLRGVVDGLLARHPARGGESWVTLEATVGALWGLLFELGQTGSAHTSSIHGEWVACIALAPFADPDQLAAALCHARAPTPLGQEKSLEGTV